MSGVDPADVWKRGCFAWEYKRKDKYKTLDEAYRQVFQYRDALDNPPLTVVCDIRTTEIRSHFPGYPTEKTAVRPTALDMDCASSANSRYNSDRWLNPRADFLVNGQR